MASKKTAKEVVQETVTVVKEVSGQTREVVNEKVSEAKKTVRETVEKNPAVAEAVKDTRATVEKVVEDTKTTARKTADKAATTAKRIVKPRPVEVVLQYAGKEVQQSVIMERVLEDYITMGNKKSTFKNVVLYIKPEDGAAYYVVDDNVSGKVAL